LASTCSFACTGTTARDSTCASVTTAVQLVTAQQQTHWVRSSTSEAVPTGKLGAWHALASKQAGAVRQPAFTACLCAMQTTPCDMNTCSVLSERLQEEISQTPVAKHHTQPASQPVPHCTPHPPLPAIYLVPHYRAGDSRHAAHILQQLASRRPNVFILHDAL
jgi:hypothetical protein